MHDDDAVVVVTTDQRLFVRFGLLGANVSGTLIEQGLARLSIGVRPVDPRSERRSVSTSGTPGIAGASRCEGAGAGGERAANRTSSEREKMWVGRTLAVEGAKVFTNGSTTTSGRVFHPLVGPVPLEDIADHRATVRIESSTGALAAIPAVQLSDDGITWYDGAGGAAGTFGTLGTERTTEGTTYGTTFAAATAADGSKRRRVRYGVAVRNNSGTQNETALVSLRIDVRRTS